MEFRNLRDELNEMSNDEKNRVIADLRNDCICHTCPTYNNCTRKSKELLYCMVGSSDCPIHEKKCLCPQDCPVYERFNLDKSFYCSFNKKRKDHLVYHKKVTRV
jgi:hypothetical protein